jgi:hypothetical protein
VSTASDALGTPRARRVEGGGSIRTAVYLALVYGGGVRVWGGGEARISCVPKEVLAERVVLPFAYQLLFLGNWILSIGDDFFRFIFPCDRLSGLAVVFLEGCLRPEGSNSCDWAI